METPERFSLKQLKAKVEDNRLDLSLSQLTIVPAKEIAELKKVTEVDLSRNRILTLPSDFCHLVNLLEIDLSSNRLTSLPERFGDLIRLQRLDLYRNELKELPLSFCKLKQLKWLDLKDNPLKEQLQTAAGDCLNDTQCKQAATRVVAYMRKLQSEHERERQKLIASEREKEATKKLKEEAEFKQLQAEKKKQKENRKKNTHQMANGSQHSSIRSNEQKFDQDNTKKGSKKQKKEESRTLKKNSLSRRICKFVLIAAASFLLLSGALSIFLLAQCSSQPSLSAKSSQKAANKDQSDFDLKSLCDDVRYLTKKGQLRITWNYQKAWLSTKRNAIQLTNQIWHQVEEFDFEARRKWLIEKIAQIRDQSKPTWFRLSKLINEWSKWAWQFLKAWAELTLNVVLALAKIIGQLSAHCLDWTIIHGRDLLDNYPIYIERIKYYWQNLK